MTVTPLVFGLVVTGIAATAAADGAAGRAFGWLAILLAAACTVSALFSTAFLTLWPVTAGLTPDAAGPTPEVASAAEWLTAFIPTNPIKAAAETAVAPLVVFALLFGFASRRIPPPLQLSLISVIEAMVETMLVIVRWVLWLGPLGVGALAIAVGVQLGAGAFGALLQYVLLASGACLVMAILAYPMVVAFGGISPLRFARAALPAQAVAFSTQSSLATLPAMIEAAPALRVSDETARVVLAGVRGNASCDSGNALPDPHKELRFRSTGRLRTVYVAWRNNKSLRLSHRADTGRNRWPRFPSRSVTASSGSGAATLRRPMSRSGFLKKRGPAP